MKALLLLLTITLLPLNADARSRAGTVKPALPKRIVPLPTPEESQGAIDSFGRSRGVFCSQGRRSGCR